MAFGLVIGTERALVLQKAIQDELEAREYNPDSDQVMAEYITIMLINNKSSAQITSELQDLIGADLFKPDFTKWLFEAAAKGESDSQDAGPSSSAAADAPAESEPSRPAPSETVAESSRPAHPSRNGVYQQAISQALPSSSSGSKRTASARSPSPHHHPAKSRRTNDLPTGPRAMHRGDGGNSRSLLDRVGGPANRGQKNFQRDEVQARIDNIVGGSQDPNAMMMAQGFPMGMDMNAMAAANMANPLMLQEMMMNQMALMAQMASSMGIINPATGQFGGQGFPMQGMMPNDMNMVQNGMNGFPQQGQQQQGNHPTGVNGGSRGRGGPNQRGRGMGRGRGGANTPSASQPATTPSLDAPLGSQPTQIVAPTPITPVASSSAPSASTRAAAPVPQPTYALPERPQSPTLCKFGAKCTNAHCRWSHPSPVATAESGVVLSNDPCEQGKDCKDKDCIKAHVSPAVLHPGAEHTAPPTAAAAAAPAAPSHTPAHHAPAPVQCRYGAACTRPNCSFNHPPRASHFSSNIPCRFGAACTRAGCAFQHPEGRVLPNTFHRGMDGPLTSVSVPPPGTVGTSHNRSVTFKSNPTIKQKLEQQMKEIEEKKSAAEKAVKEAEAAAAKSEAKPPVPITA